MQAIQQPLKRNIALQPLSREHHEALLFVWKVKQGIDKGILPARIANYCSWFWDTHMQSHMAQEEATLTKVLSPDHHLMNNMIEDHAAIKTKVEQVLDDPSYDLIKRFAEIIYYHVRFEERDLFPAIERNASYNQLSQISLELENHETHSDWPDAFWLNTGGSNAA